MADSKNDRKRKLAFVIIASIAASMSKSYRKTPESTSVRTGRIYFEEIYYSPNAAKFLSHTRMNIAVFDELLLILKRDGGLQDGPEVCSGEKLMIYLEHLGNLTNRQLKSNWNHSGSTIHDSLDVVIDSILKLEGRVIVSPTADYLSDRIRDNPKFMPFFEDCIGGLDGSHFGVSVENSKPALKGACMGRKGRTTNLLACTNFEMLLTYYLVGWEGTTHSGPRYRFKTSAVVGSPVFL
jgi:hypothetical protein